MKRSLISILVFSMIYIFYACETKETQENQKTKKELYYWGYFNGFINGENISIENDRYESPIYTVKHGIGTSEVNSLNTVISIDEFNTLIIHLFDLKQNVRYIENGYFRNWDDSVIRYVYSPNGNNNDKDRVTYVPKKNNPLKVEITDIIWKSPLAPIMEAKIKGTLYSINNEETTLKIDASYGTK